MSLPSVTTTIRNRGLGFTPQPLDGKQLKIGACSQGTVNTVYSFSNAQSVIDTLGYGQLVEAAILSLQTSVNGVSGQPVYCMRVDSSISGVAGEVVAVVDTATGTITVAGTPNDTYDVLIEIVDTGTLGTGSFKYSLDGGSNESEEISIPTGATYVMENTGLTLTFVPGAGPVFFESGDTYSFKTVGPSYTTGDLVDCVTAILAQSVRFEFIHLVGPTVPDFSDVTSTGTTPPTLTVSGTPVDYYHVTVEIVVGGTRGTATFRVSFDNGTSWTTTVATAATYDLEGTGITLNFPTGTYNADNAYTFNTCNLDGFGAVVTAFATHMSTFESNQRYMHCWIEAPNATDAELLEAVDGIESNRVGVCAGFAKIVDATTGDTDTRNMAWLLTARLAAIKPHVSPAKTDDGSIQQVGQADESLLRDERVTPGLEPRFATLRTYNEDTIGGVYITSGRLLSAPTSDFQFVQYRRVMDKACMLTNSVLFKVIDKDLVLNGDGTIEESQARSLENEVAAVLRTKMIQEKNCVAAFVEIDRTNNVNTSQTLKYTTNIQPVGYARFIQQSIGFFLPEG